VCVAVENWYRKDVSVLYCAAGVLGHGQQGFRGGWLWWICKERM